MRTKRTGKLQRRQRNNMYVEAINKIMISNGRLQGICQENPADVQSSVKVTPLFVQYNYDLYLCAGSQF